MPKQDESITMNDITQLKHDLEHWQYMAITAMNAIEYAKNQDDYVMGHLDLEQSLKEIANIKHLLKVKYGQN